MQGIDRLRPRLSMELPGAEFVRCQAETLDPDSKVSHVGQAGPLWLHQEYQGKTSLK
jgi:hypothetical protein